MAGAAVAFLSYAHVDDEHDGGNITAFRKALEGEVRVQTGWRDVRIFQDRDDIAWGQAWQERVDTSLDAVSFFIPVLTPSFFTSEQCRRELLRFLDRERQMKRGDLVLPVYWVSTPLLEDPARQAADALARELSARQYADWRELRFRRPDDPGVRQALAALATHIRDTLDTADQQPNSYPASHPEMLSVDSVAAGPADATPAAGEPASGGPDFVVSYVTEDKAWAEWITWELQTAGYRPSLDAWDAVPGGNRIRWLNQTTDNACRALVVLSPNYLASPETTAQWDAAFSADADGAGQQLILVIVQPCRPQGLLGSRIAIELVDLDEEEARSRLLAGIEAATPGAARPARMPVLPGHGGPDGAEAPRGRYGMTGRGGSSHLAPPGFPGVRLPAGLVDFLARVADACRELHPGASVTRAVSPGGLRYLDVRAEADDDRHHWPVGVCPGDLDAATLENFVDEVHAEHERREPLGESELVYGGVLAEATLDRRARRLGVRLRSVLAFERGWDPRSYVARQTEKLERDQIYPPGLYIPQRYIRLDEPRGTPPRDDVFAAVVHWLDAEDPRLLLVLADFGHGKTFLTRELARRLPAILPRLTPMRIDLHTFEKSHSLDTVLAVHLQNSGEDGVAVKALRRMLERGRLLLIFDGFDELALRLTFDGAAEHLNMILSAMSGHAKVIVTSRPQHFASDDQWRTQLGEQVHLIPASRLIRLVDFDDTQIRDFLVRLFTHHAGRDGQAAPRTPEGLAAIERRADERLALIHDIRDLLGLSKNPRMLSFIAELPEDDLLAAKSADGTISSADLYRALVDRWLNLEVTRRHPTRGALPSLRAEQLHTAATAIAIRLWARGEQFLELTDLDAAVRAVLPDLGPMKLNPDQAIFVVGSGSLLTRDDENRFSFVHASVLEYLVAVDAARQVAAAGGADILGLREISDLMVDFVCGSTAPADRPVLEAWVRDVLTSPDDPVTGQAATAAPPATESLASPGSAKAPVAARRDRSQIARENALAVARRLGLRVVGARLAGQDLRGRDLSRLNLRYADLTGANMAGVRLHGADLTGADLTGADLTGARLVRPRLTRARLTGSRWGYAALLAPTLDDTARSAPELASAAVTGRDPAEPILLPPQETLLLPPTTTVHDVTWSPDGTLLAAAFGLHVLITSGIDLRVIRVLTGHTRWVNALAFSSGGQFLAAGDGGRDSYGRVRVWELASGRVVSEFAGQTGPVHMLAFSSDGQFLATGDGGRDAFGRVRVWELASGRVVSELAGHTDPVSTLAFSPDGRLLATGAGILGLRGRVRLWELVSGRQRSELGYHTGRQPSELAGPTGRVRTLAFSPDGRLLATGDGNVGGARVWELASGRVVSELAGNTGPVHVLAFSPDGRLLATGDGILGLRGRVRLWELVSGRQRSELAGHTGRVRTLAFSPDGRLLATGGGVWSGRVRVWELASDRVVSELAGHTGPVHVLAFSPDGRLLVTGDGNVNSGGRVRVWEPAAGRVLHELVGDTGWVTTLAFSPDGRLIAAGDSGGRGSGGRVRVWEPASARVVSEFTGHAGPVTTLAFSPDGRLLATGDSDWGPEAGRVRVWDLASGRRLGELTGHTGWVTALAFSPDGRLLATADGGGITRIWDASTYTLVASFIGFDDGWAVLLPDGSYKLVGDSGGRLWWAMKLCRFEPGEIDGFDPPIHRLDPESPLAGLERYQFQSSVTGWYPRTLR